MRTIRTAILSIMVASTCLLATPPSADAKDAKSQCLNCISRVVSRYMATNHGTFTENGKVNKSLTRRVKRRCTRSRACRKAFPDMLSELPK